MVTALVATGVGLVALAVGMFLGSLRQRGAFGRANATADEVVRDARIEAQRLLDRAESEARALAETYREREEDTMQHRRIELDASQDRLAQRETTLEQRAANLAQREAHLLTREAEATEALRAADSRMEDARQELEALAGFDGTAAKAELMQRVEDEARRDAMVLMRDLEVKAREEADRRARRILTSTVQRLASEVVSETTVSVVELPNDDMKGRIIGRDGRNIRAFESVTGVNIIVDDTPEAVTLSAFDPVRREVAKRALLRLVEDGRIHPASIEEAYEKAFAEVEQTVRDAGEWAIVEVGISRLHPEIVNLLGRLRYRMSYGQNVLHHLIESARVAEMLAAELGVDPIEARRAAFLHDIGKAVSHQLGGSHALVGAEIARRFGEEAGVVHGIEAHHNEVEPRTLTAIIVQAADAVSAARTGARREAIQSYVRRLEALEDIAMSFDGVEKVFAMQAGREVRVVVDPGAVDDLLSHDLARRISKRFEEELQYPGQIQVTVIRELRATDYARVDMTDLGMPVVRESRIPTRAGRRYLVRTFGCQMNEHDSERIAGLFEADGMIPASGVDDADVVLLNTCCIRENADNRLYGNLGQLKAQKDTRPDMRILVSGCLAQKDRETVRQRAPWVDVVFGTHNLHRVVTLLDHAEEWGPVTEVWEETRSIDDVPSSLPTRRETAHSAWVTITIGCNNGCTFCIVPAVRGREISRRPGDIVREVASLANDGVVEVTLLGQNVNSYGRDLAIDGRHRPVFAELLRSVGAVDGIERVRFTSPHPKDIREDVMEAMAATSAVCEQLHLPLQSGSQRILRAMQRGYTPERFIEKLRMAERIVPGLTTSTDVIVGFPGETEEDFEATLDVMREARFDNAYMFVYSPRPGTRAADMDDQVEPAVARQRFERLVELQQTISLEKNEAMVGSTLSVLVEGPSHKDPEMLTARTRGNKVVHFPGSAAPGTFHDVAVRRAAPSHLMASAVS